MSSKSLMLRILMSDVVKDTASTTAVFLRASLPKGAVPLGVIAIPSIVDMIGFSGGGGPPGFAYLIDPEEEVMEELLLAAVMTEHPLPQGFPGISFKALGVMQCRGHLLMGIELRGEVLEELVSVIEDGGGLVCGSRSYVAPGLLSGVGVKDNG